MPSSDTKSDLPASSSTSAYHASLAPLLTRYSILITRLDDLLYIIVHVRLQSPHEELPRSVLEKMRNDLNTARKQYVQALTYWKDRRIGGRKMDEKLDESFERVVSAEMEQCDVLIARVYRQLSEQTAREMARCNVNYDAR
jgi:hypothetical protein